MSLALGSPPPILLVDKVGAVTDHNGATFTTRGTLTIPNPGRSVDILGWSIHNLNQWNTNEYGYAHIGISIDGGSTWQDGEDGGIRAVGGYSGAPIAFSSRHSRSGVTPTGAIHVRVQVASNNNVKDGLLRAQIVVAQ